MSFSRVDVKIEPDEEPEVSFSGSAVSVHPQVAMTTKRAWSKEETFSLIYMYEELPELWNAKSKAYRDRNKKEKAIQAIADKFHCTVAEIQRKLHNLRTQECHEWRKYRKRKIVHGSDDIYKSSWEYFEVLKFLITENSPAQVDDNLKVKDAVVENRSEEESVNSVPSHTQKAKKKKTDHDADDKIVKKAMYELNKPSDEFQIFGDYVASELRSLKHDKNKRTLKRMIQKAILDISTIDDDGRCESANSPVSTYQSSGPVSNESTSSQFYCS